MTNEEAVGILKFELDGDKESIPNISYAEYREALIMAIIALEKTGRLEHFEIKADGTLFIEGGFDTDKVTRVLLSNPRTHSGGLLYWD